MTFKLSKCLIVLCFLTCKPVFADPEFRIGGFGTLGVMHSDNHLADFTTDFKPKGVGYTRKYDFGGDSLFGIQGDVIFDDKVSASLQLIHRIFDGETDFKTDVELANVKFKITPNLTMHLGRLGFPAFIASDYRLVNYANVWARAPSEVYKQEPLTHLDGISVRYQTELGGGIFNTQVVYFGHSGKSPQGNTSKGHGSALWNASYEQGPWTARALLSSFAVSNPNAFNRFRTVLANVPGGAQAIDRLFGNKTRGKYYSIGTVYDPGDYFFQGEYSYLDTDKGFVNTTNSWYALAGFRKGKWSPYMMISELKSKGPFEDSFASAMANGSFGPSLTAFGNVISRVIALRNQSQITMAVGVRYDIIKNIALKVQYDHIHLKDGSNGMYSYPVTQATSAGDANITSINLDFIF